MLRSNFGAEHFITSVHGKGQEDEMPLPKRALDAGHRCVMRWCSWIPCLRRVLPLSMMVYSARMESMNRRSHFGAAGKHAKNETDSLSCINASQPCGTTHIGVRFGTGPWLDSQSLGRNAHEAFYTKALPRRKRLTCDDLASCPEKTPC